MKKTDQSKIDEWIRLYKSGSSTFAISQKYGVPPITVNRRLRASGVPIRTLSEQWGKSKKWRVKKISDEVVVNLYKKTRDSKAICRRFKISTRRVSKILKSNGIVFAPSRWKGGRTFHSNGYVMLRKPHHVLADARGYVFEHRLVMQKLLKRPLKKTEVVHHIDEDKTNNAESNLMLFPSHQAHKKFHWEFNRAKNS